MKFRPPHVLADACVLVKSAVRDVFLDLGQAGLIELHLTPEIFQEFARNWAKVRLEHLERKRKRDRAAPLPRGERQKLVLELQRKAWNLIDAFEKMIPQWPVPGWVSQKEAERYWAPSSFLVGTQHGVDAKDLHVALAAVRLKTANDMHGVDAESEAVQETWLLTENLRDLPGQIMARFGVWSVHPGDALEALFAMSPSRVAASLEKTRLEWRQPPVDVTAMLELLRDPNQFGSQRVHDQMQSYWENTQAAG